MPSLPKRPDRWPVGKAGRSANTEIQSLRNLGPKTAAWLAGIGITTRAELAQVGAIEAYAIQGALMDCDWRALPPEFRRKIVLNQRTEWNLLMQNPMEPGVHGMGRHARSDDPAEHLHGRIIVDAFQVVLRQPLHVLRVLLRQGEDQDLLVRKVLVQRADAHPSPFGHPIRGQPVIAVGRENVSRCRENRLNGRLGSFLLGRLRGGDEAVKALG